MENQIGCATSHSNISLLLKVLVVLLGCSTLAGCGFDPFGTKQEVREVRTSTSEDINTVRKDLQRLGEEVGNLSARFDRYSAAEEKEIAALKSAVSGMESRLTETSASALSEMNKKTAELDAKRVADKNELVTKINSIIDRINALSKRGSAASPPKPGSTETATEKGFYYTVEEGDTLWEIANKYKKYGVTLEAVRQANNMNSSDSRIVTGQKLFIPVKQ